MIGADGAYRGLEATCDYGAAASDTGEGWIEIHSRYRFEHPDHKAGPSRLEAEPPSWP